MSILKTTNPHLQNPYNLISQDCCTFDSLFSNLNKGVAMTDQKVLEVKVFPREIQNKPGVEYIKNISLKQAFYQRSNGLRVVFCIHIKVKLKEYNLWITCVKYKLVFC